MAGFHDSTVPRDLRCLEPQGAAHLGAHVWHNPCQNRFRREKNPVAIEKPEIDLISKPWRLEQSVGPGAGRLGGWSDLPHPWSDPPHGAETVGAFRAPLIGG